MLDWKRGANTYFSYTVSRIQPTITRHTKNTGARVKIHYLSIVLFTIVPKTVECQEINPKNAMCNTTTLKIIKPLLKGTKKRPIKETVFYSHV